MRSGALMPLWVKSGHDSLSLDVRFTPESGHQTAVLRCPLSAKSRHMHRSNFGLFNHLVGEREQVVRKFDSQSSCRLHVDDEAAARKLTHRHPRYPTGSLSPDIYAGHANRCGHPQAVALIALKPVQANPMAVAIIETMNKTAMVKLISIAS